MAAKSAKPWLIPALVVLLLGAAVCSLLLGPVTLSPLRMLATFAGHGDAVARIILIELRLPRMLLGLGVGAMLGIAGATLQGYLRNPLAEPSVLGTSNAASLGAVAALYFGLAELHPLVLPLLAVLGAILSLVLLFALAGESESPLTPILAGIAVSTLAGAGISLSGGTYRRPRRIRCATCSVVSTAGSARSSTPSTIFLPASSVSTSRSILGCADSIETCSATQSASSGRKA